MQSGGEGLGWSPAMRRLVFALLLAAAPAQAVPIQTPTGFLALGREWLRPSETRGLSYEEAAALPGYRHATPGELCALLAELGSSCVSHDATPDEVAGLFDLLGWRTQEFWVGRWSEAWVGPLVGNVAEMLIVRDTVNDESEVTRGVGVIGQRYDLWRSEPTMRPLPGHMLVSLTAIPEAGTVALVAGGLALLGAARRRRGRSSRCRQADSPTA